MLRLLLVCAMTLLALSSHAEQMRRFGNWEVHYIVLPTQFLKPDIATRYSIVRGRDRSFVNISVLDPQDNPTTVAIDGHCTNLLGQQQALQFREVSEGGAVYYVAQIKHSDEEVLRFRITISAPGTREMLLEFQQKLYWDEE